MSERERELSEFHGDSLRSSLTPASRSNYASLNPWHTKKDNVVLVAYLNGNASSSVQKRRIQAKTNGGAHTVR